MMVRAEFQMWPSWPTSLGGGFNYFLVFLIFFSGKFNWVVQPPPWNDIHQQIHSSRIPALLILHKVYILIYISQTSKHTNWHPTNHVSRIIVGCAQGSGLFFGWKGYPTYCIYIQKNNTPPENNIPWFPFKKMGPFSGHIRFIFAGELTISLDDKLQKVAPQPRPKWPRKWWSERLKKTKAYWANYPWTAARTTTKREWMVQHLCR